MLLCLMSSALERITSQDDIIRGHLQDDRALLLGAEGQGLGLQVRAGFQLCCQPGNLLVPPPQRRLQQYRNYSFDAHFI